jgi:carbonic anhydrase/acetyltransferase-like protein (isoleucine patch superfamily)
MSADGTELDLLSQIQDRLREKVPFTVPQCFLCDTPVPEIFPPSGPICTISVGASSFDPELFDGGGFNQLCQHTPVYVTVLVRSALDLEATCWVTEEDPSLASDQRNECELIEIGARSQIQDNATLHTDPGFPLTIGRGCVIGHNVVLHGCTIGDGSLIGMGATILNGARIGRGCLIGAGALVTEGKEIPDGSLVMGSPGRVVRVLDADARARLLKSASGYQANARRFRAGLVAL